jgi:hypothetical protein
MQTDATTQTVKMRPMRAETRSPQVVPARVTGWLLGLTFAADGLGVLLLSAADARSRSGASGGYPLFWAGLASILVPSAGALMLSRQSKEVRLVLTLGFGLALYLAKVVYEPTAFTFHDEFAHYRNAVNLLASGQLFGYNPLIRTTAYYPGLAVATDAVARITGLPVYTCGLILVGSARVTLTGTLFLLAERLFDSSRVAGIAVLVYAANPNFLYWDAQYAYESLALPLAILAIFLIARRRGVPPSLPATLSSLAVGLAVVVTHHVTAWALAILLIAWAVAAWLQGRRHDSMEYAPAVPAAVTGGAVIVWLVAVASITVGYLGPVISRAVVQGVQLVTQHQTSRTLFANTGQTATAPLWEDAAAIGATLIIIAALPQALDRMRGINIPLLARLLAASSLLWVILLPLRFTVGGQETANRSSEFAYVGVAICIAFLLDSSLDSARWQRLFAFGIVILLFVGGVAVSWNYAQRLALDYKQTNGSVAVTPDDEALAAWMLTTLGPGHRIATDTETGLALGSLGRQDVLSAAENNARIWLIFYPTTINSEVLGEIRSERVQYVVVQQDLLQAPTGVPRFDGSEPAQDYDLPLASSSFTKFRSSPLFQEIYAAGTLRVYKVVVSAGGRQP